MVFVAVLPFVRHLACPPFLRQLGTVPWPAVAAASALIGLIGISSAGRLLGVWLLRFRREPARTSDPGGPPARFAKRWHAWSLGGPDSIQVGRHIHAATCYGLPFVPSCVGGNGEGSAQNVSILRYAPGTSRRLVVDPPSRRLGAAH